MKRKVAAFFLVFGLFFSFSVSETSANFEKEQALDPVYGIYDGTGGPVEIMPPLG